MTKVAAHEAKVQLDVERPTPQFQLPDSDSTAEIALAQALKFCAQKMGLAGPETVTEYLRRGNRNARTYCHYSIARKVAESLGALDRKLKAVYLVDYDATPEDLCFSEGMQVPLIHLIIWAERKTNALDSLVTALDRALVKRYADLIGAHQLAHLLDIHVVDDEDVKNRIGYGAMLSSLHNRPIQIWKR